MMSGYPDTMSGRGRWHEGRRIWSRLNGWHQDDASATPGHPDDGASALDALADVGYLRHLLDQVELSAVRTARRHGRSWAEIATKLGVSRQSAWERWRDLDGEPAPEVAPATGVDTSTIGMIEAAAAAELVETATARDQVASARERRRRSSVVVPNVIGLPFDDARRALQNRGLYGVGPDLDGPPLAAIAGPNGIVRDQTPEAGAKVPAGSTVTLWFDPGGGSGVREPRRPKPGPRTARQMRDEPSDEAVG
jgi:hypothetical protein